jgi:hypothetical protein
MSIQLTSTSTLYVSVVFDEAYHDANWERRYELAEVMANDLDYVFVDGFDEGRRGWHLYLSIAAKDIPRLKDYVKATDEFKDYICIEI